METLNVTIAIAAIFGWSIVLAQWILHEPRRWKKIYTPHDLRITRQKIKRENSKIF